jgi:hypothetical protein
MDIISFGLASKVSKALKDVIGDSKLSIPSGTTSERPSLLSEDKAVRFNTDTNGLEEWNGTEWKNVSAPISVVTVKGTDTSANILSMVDMAVADLWIASDTLDGYVYNGVTWINIGPLKGNKGDQGIQGIQGIQGNTGDALTITTVVDNLEGTYTWNFSDNTSFITGNLIGPQGAKGDTGEGLNILGSTTDESLLPIDNNIGDGYIISGYLYVWTGTLWENVGLIQGDKGDKGDKGDIGETGLTGLTGLTGDTGDIGVGISGISKVSGTGELGTTDVYEILLTNNERSTFNVKNGEPGDTYLLRKKIKMLEFGII